MNSPEEIYSSRIMKSKLKQYRDCRADKDHLAALQEVFNEGHRLGTASGRHNALEMAMQISPFKK